MNNELVCLKEMLTSDGSVNSKLQNMFDCIANKNYPIFFNLIPKKCYEAMMSNEELGCNLVSLSGVDSLEQYLRSESPCFAFSTTSNKYQTYNQTTQDKLDDVLYSIHFFQVINLF